MSAQARQPKSTAPALVREFSSRGVLQEPVCFGEDRLMEFDAWMTQQLGELEERFRSFQTRESLLLSVGR